MNFYHAVASNKSVAVTGPVTSGIEGWWDADDASVGDTNLADKSSNYGSSSNTLVLRNGASVVSLSGVKAAYLDGANDYLSASSVAGDPYVVADLTSVTHEIWIRSNGSWVSNGNIVNQAFEAGLRTRISGTDLWVYANDLAESWTGHTTVPTNTWVHLAFTVKTNEIKVYKDGQLSATDNVGTWNPTYTSRWLVYGARASNSEFQRMYVAIARYYPDVYLSASDIQRNYNAEKTRFGHS
jgi:hypothetical protein